MLEEDHVQKEDKREAILQAALTLIAENGFQHTPMSLISKRAKASAGIIYHYFDSKDDLIQSLYRRIKEDMDRALFAADDPKQPLARRFQSLWLSIFRYCFTHQQEMVFLEQYESLPAAKQQAKQEYESILLGKLHDAPLSNEAKVLYGLMEDLCNQDLLKDLPLEVISELTFGIALRLAQQAAVGLVTLDESMLTTIASACWDAITR